MIWFLTKAAGFVLVVAAVAALAYEQGRISLREEVHQMDRDLAVLEYRLDKVTDGLTVCVDLAEYYRDSAVAANALLASTDPLSASEIAALGGAE